MLRLLYLCTTSVLASLYLICATFSPATASARHCHSVKGFEPSIFRQLEPFFGGIDAKAFEASRRLYTGEEA